MREIGYCDCKLELCEGRCSGCHQSPDACDCKLEFRRIVDSDYSQVACILALSYSSLEGSQWEALAVLQSEISRGYHYELAVIGSRVVGLTAWFYHGLPKHGLIEIDRFATLPYLRSNGVGTKLFSFLLTDANLALREMGGAGLRRIFLFTRASNVKAHQFYYKLGFVRQPGVIQNLFYDDKDDILLTHAGNAP